MMDNHAMLVLASASPRRRELLTQAGFEFRIHPANIPEDPLPGEDPIHYVTRLARQKAEAVFHQMAGAPGLAPETGETGITVLGADTTVVLGFGADNQILGKPELPTYEEAAANMLRQLSGRTHRVITEVTTVQFLTLSEEEIAAYIATNEPRDKAGAYAIQGLAARWIPRIEGCYFNVVGLPISLVSTLLQSLKN
jgi:septum formation protein